MRAPILLLCAAPFITVLDANAVAVALPPIRDDLGFSRTGLQWVVGGYSLAFGGGMLAAGRAADLYGPRRLLVLGLALFSAASLAGALAPSAPALLAARPVQGLGAAVAFPASLALITGTTEPGESRNRALGMYGAVASAGFLAGTIGGGLLAASLGWRSTLVPGSAVAAGAALTTPRVVAEMPRAAGERRLALPGALLATAGVLALLYGLGQAVRDAPRAAAVLVVAALLFGLALRMERRSPHPLLPRTLVRRREARVAVLGAFLTVGTGVSTVFILSLHLQDVLGYDPLAAGLALSLLGVAGVSAGLLAPAIARRTGLSRALASALIVQAAGVALLTLVETERGFVLVGAGTAIMGFGHFAATVAFTALASGGGLDDEYGVAMGAIGSAQQIGGAVGLALVVAVVTATEGSGWALASGAGLSLLGAALVTVLSAPRGPGPARRPGRGLRTTRRRAPSSRR